MITITVGFRQDDSDHTEKIEMSVKTRDGVNIEAVIEEVTQLLVKWLVTWLRYADVEWTFKKG